MVYAACGDTSRAQSMFDAARTAAPKNFFLTSIVMPMLRARNRKEPRQHRLKRFSCWNQFEVTISAGLPVSQTFIRADTCISNNAAAMKRRRSLRRS